jgi:ParB family chromosome partitioning protein
MAMSRSAAKRALAEEREMALNEWYSPPHVVEAARHAMGAIDLDPASCEAANKIVKATTFFTIRDDGLKQPWHGRIWLNPPYGKFAPKFSMKFNLEFLRGGIPSACLLLAVHHMNTEWFCDSVSTLAPSMCLPKRRLQFSNSTERPAHGSVILGFNIDKDIFKSIFDTIGVTLVPTR